jgi:hypothetical protein
MLLPRKSLVLNVLPDLIDSFNPLDTLLRNFKVGTVVLNDLGDTDLLTRFLKHTDTNTALDPRV